MGVTTRSRSVAPFVVAVRLCPARDACVSHCNRASTSSALAASAAHRRSGLDPNSPAGVSRSDAQHRGSARTRNVNRRLECQGWCHARSIAAIASAWLRRNVRQLCDGGLWHRIIYLETVDSAVHRKWGPLELPGELWRWPFSVYSRPEIASGSLQVLHAPQLRRSLARMRGAPDRALSRP
jgi:hypothetical protein